MLPSAIMYSVQKTYKILNILIFFVIIVFNFHISHFIIFKITFLFFKKNYNLLWEILQDILKVNEFRIWVVGVLWILLRKKKLNNRKVNVSMFFFFRYSTFQNNENDQLNKKKKTSAELGEAQKQNCVTNY